MVHWIKPADGKFEEIPCCIVAVGLAYIVVVGLVCIVVAFALGIVDTVEVAEPVEGLSLKNLYRRHYYIVEEEDCYIHSHSGGEYCLNCYFKAIKFT